MEGRQRSSYIGDHDGSVEDQRRHNVVESISDGVNV